MSSISYYSNYQPPPLRKRPQNNIRETFQTEPTFDSKKVAAAIQKIHGGNDEDEEEEAPNKNYGGEFVAPPYPKQTKLVEPYVAGGWSGAEIKLNEAIKKTPSFSNNDELMQKLNFIITLLEMQQDAKTNHVTEEVILYSFVGIFVIFMADVFVKFGAKYTR